MLRWLFRAVVAGCICGAVFISVKGIKHILTTSELFTVKTVEVRGISHTDRERLKLLYQPLVGKNIFSEIEPGSLMTEDPWVVRIEMKRVMPDKLVVQVVEEQEILSYRVEDKCLTLTKLGNNIPTECEQVKINIIEALPEEFNEFITLYNNSEFVRESYVTLNKGFFLIKNDNETIMGNYQPEVFMENYKVYAEQIRERYKKIDHVDMTVRGKVYVKGVIHG